MSRTATTRRPKNRLPAPPVSIDVALAMLGGISKDTFERNYQAALTDAREKKNRRPRCKRYFHLDELLTLQADGVKAVYTLRKALRRI